MSDLYLRVKQVWFNDIKTGIKGEEYRLVKPYWAKLIVDREYDKVIVTWAIQSGTITEKFLSFHGKAIAPSGSLIHTSGPMKSKSSPSSYTTPSNGRQHKSK